jgi:hypothetical protein
MGKKLLEALRCAILINVKGSKTKNKPVAEKCLNCVLWQAPLIAGLVCQEKSAVIAGSMNFTAPLN